MKYDLMTLARFIERLRNGRYKNATAARRAIVKMTWSAKDTARARAAVEKHFAAAPEVRAVRALSTAQHIAACRTVNDGVRTILSAVASSRELSAQLDRANTLLFDCLETTVARMRGLAR